MGEKKTAKNGRKSKDKKANSESESKRVDKNRFDGRTLLKTQLFFLRNSYVLNNDPLLHRMGRSLTTFAITT